MSYAKGLEGVVAGETAISNVEGDIGRLSYRGYPIEELIDLEYTAVMWLVLFGELPDANEKALLDRFLRDNGEVDERDLQALAALPDRVHPMRMLQSMIPVMATTDATFRGMDDEASRGLQIIARLPMLIAAFHRLEAGDPPPVFDGGQTCLGNFLSMFTGGPALEQHEEILKVVQILQMEHSYNASTFVARCVASTLAPVESVLSAATGSLSGILHGGADEAALDDAKKAGSPDRAAAFVDDLLARNGKLMGMGHREYRRVDPRSVVLKPMAEQLCKGTRFENVFDTLRAMETAFSRRMAEKGKDIKANLEFYKGAVYETIGIPSKYFTAVFAMSRAVGWLAHFMESRRDNRIIRPCAVYVGPGLRKPD